MSHPQTNEVVANRGLKRKFEEDNVFQVPDKNPFENNTLGLFTVTRTYSRRHKEDDPDSTVESFPEILTRVVESCNSQLKTGFTREQSQEFFEMMYNLECMVGGRPLWQLGTKTVETLGLPSLQNCAMVVVNEPIRPFTWTMDMLMLGCGVGFRILPTDVESLPVIKYAHNIRKDTKDADYIVPDSREGWSTGLLGKILESHFITGKSFTYSCLLLRSKGAPIKSFGGLASGPEVLCEGIAKIDEILNKRKGLKLRPIDALDIMCIIGMIVVSGNVRRSALLALGDCKDKEYLMAKRWDIGNIPNYRAYANLSVVCNDISELLDNEEFWAGYNGNGEPYGIVNLKLSREYGRVGDRRYPDPTVEGYNPCAEQSLANFETCCLAEVFLPNIKSRERLLKCVKYLYIVCKRSLMLPCNSSEETERVVHENMRMGIGMTGYLQATEEQKSWLPDCYEMLRAYDKMYSIENGFPVSVKLTTCKPSGTLGIVGGVTPGVHPAYARWLKRRVRISSNSKLIEVAKKHGYPVEYQKNFDGTIDHTTMIITFPISYPEGTILAKDCSAITQLEWVKRLQTDWSDNSVSVTVYYKKEELPAIREYLKKNYNTSIKTVSFLLHSEHGFLQAPLEEISEAEFNALKSACRPITDLEGICWVNESAENISGTECAGGVCPVR